MGTQTSGKGNQSKSWSMSEPPILGKGKDKENQGKSKVLYRGNKSENRSAKGSCEGKMLEMGQVDNADTSWIHEELSLAGIVLDVAKTVNRYVVSLQAHFQLKAQNGRR